MDKSRNNCLSLIRMLAAFQVMAGHIIVHLNVNVPAGGKIALKILNLFQGVPIFFFISGYLIWGSIERSGNFKNYLKKRFLRIYPELWLGVVAEIILLAVFIPHVSAALLGLFAVTQGTVLQFWTPDAFRSFGCGTPNGSLWTICVLIQFYLIAYVVYRWLKGKRCTYYVVLFALSLLVSVLFPLFMGSMPTILYKLYNQTLIPYFWIFVLGIMIAEYQIKIIPFLKKAWPAFLLISYLVSLGNWDLNHDGYGVLRCSFLVLGVLGFAYCFPKLHIPLDFSYSLYIWHMLVVNCLISIGLTGRLRYAFLAVVISCAVALCSNILIKLLLTKRSMHGTTQQNDSSTDRKEQEQ